MDKYHFEREEIARFMRRLYRQNLTTTSGGNISCRCADGNIAITAIVKNPAPALTPMRFGAAMGLFITACIITPDTASAEPAAIAPIARGSLMWSRIFKAVSSC